MKKLLILPFLLLLLSEAYAQQAPAGDPYQYLSYEQLKQAFQRPPESAKPWVFWYWMQAAISKPGITADLEAMKDAGIAGAYLMPIKDTTSPPLYLPAIRQLTPEWWDMMRHAMKEADRLGLKIGMHVSDGFALAGGPWITPELSMQKVVWSRVHVTGNVLFNENLPQPPSKENYYQDIAVYAYPTPLGEDSSSAKTVPVVTTSTGDDAQFLTSATNTKNFSSGDPCWIQYTFAQPFTCRSIVIRTSGNNYQAHRLKIQVSNDGQKFVPTDSLESPRFGWQDTDEDVTHSIRPVTAKYFRFVYSNTGSEPGSEDLDAAKWKQSLKVAGIELRGAAAINQYESKNGSMWRISKRTTPKQVPDSLCVSLDKMINLTAKMDASGRLSWQVPTGNWTIIRMGHTSTGHTNATGGAGIGLECDKFNPLAIKTQFDGWFGEAVRQAGPELAAKVLKLFHIDSWECGSQNWSPFFRKEFMDKRGYDPVQFLPAMAGVPLASVDSSERFLHDIRETIAELVADTFYVTMAGLAHEQGCTFTAESVAPTMLSDGMLHYREVDVPMGEFWLHSPTHDKPNDMLDAISGAHVYGKPVIQAEAFTTVRMDWNEYPAMLKPLQDLNYALGINRLVYHVFMHNPWMDRKPGMTLDGVGLYFQRNQTWWKQGKAWVDYATRCQALLQTGKPVADIAVFTGEELPRRAILPDRLVNTLPGLFGKEKVEAEKIRLANVDQPLREMPMGVRHSANMADPEDWVNALHGYAYDSFNPDVLLTATTENNEIVLPGGARYKLLVLPGERPMSPGDMVSAEVATKLYELVNGGASIIINEKSRYATGLRDDVKLISQTNNKMLLAALKEPPVKKEGVSVYQLGKGRLIQGPYTASSLEPFAIHPDVIFTNDEGLAAEKVAWTHRQSPAMDIYFIANQLDSARILNVSLRTTGKQPELWNAVTGEIVTAGDWHINNNRTELPVRLDANASVFIVLAKPVTTKTASAKNWSTFSPVQTLAGSWMVKFDTAYGGPLKPVTFPDLTSWSEYVDTSIRYYSGTAIYNKTFTRKNTPSGRTWIDLGKVDNIASVKLNGIDCGVAWTYPFRVDISKALKKGINKLEIAVTNTWANRLIGDQRLPTEKRVTNTTAPTRYAGNTLHPAGLFGPVTVVKETK